MITIAVIGAGASGLMAALCAAECGAEVLLFEKNKEAGRKLNATGNGRGNIANRFMGPEFYHSSDPERLRTLIANADRDHILQKFGNMGVLFHERNGYIYPRTDLASTLTDALMQQMTDKSVRCIFGSPVTDIRKKDGRFLIKAGETIYSSDKVILAGGGLAGPQFGAGGDLLRAAAGFGHTVTELYPALTCLCTDDPNLKSAAGVRAHAGVSLYSDKDSNKAVAAAQGEVQFNRDNVSGIPVFEISRYVSPLLTEGVVPILEIDLLPELDNDDWNRIVQIKMEETRNRNIREWLQGLIHPKLSALVAAESSLAAESKIRKLSSEKKLSILQSLRCLSFRIIGTGTYKDAQVTAGGVRINEITDSYESVFCKGLYLVGEMLDVDGICGGYNLTFAMSSGRTAAAAAAEMRNV